MLSLTLISAPGIAQPIICSGNPLTGINGTAYDSVAGTGASLFGSVANSRDGKLFATNDGKLRYISADDFSVTDSMDIDISYFTGRQSDDTMFGLRTNGTLCRFNTASKTLIDSLPLAGRYHSRVAERPLSKEVWISGDPVIVVDYTGGLTAGDTFAIGGNINSVKLSSDGTKAYASSGITNRIYIIDAVNKVLTDSMDFPESPNTFELSADDSKLFVAATGNIKVYQLSGKTLIDSANVTMTTTGLYRHPDRPEIWCVHHFADSVSIFDADTYALIDSISVGGSPFFLAFGRQEGTAVRDVAGSAGIRLYPNPAGAVLTIALEAACRNVAVYNMAGGLVFSKNTGGTNVSLDTETLAGGIYFVKATDERGRTYAGTFVKK